MIADVLDEEEARGGFRVVRGAAGLEATLADGGLEFVLHLEGLRPLAGSAAAVAEFYELGVRSAQLTWNGPNELAAGVDAEPAGGLTTAGREVVAELDRLGMLLDVSHLAEPSFWDLDG